MAKYITVKLSTDQVSRIMHLLDADNRRLYDRLYIQKIADAVAFNKRLITKLAKAKIS